MMLSKLESILKKQKNVNVENIISFLDAISKKIKNSGIIELDESETNELINYLDEIGEIGESEKQFLKNFVNLEQVSKEYLFQESKFLDEELEFIDSLSAKIIKAKKHYSNFKNQINPNEIVRKLSSGKAIFLTEEEMEYISTIIDEEQFSINEKIEVWLLINEINKNVFNTYNLSFDEVEDDEILTEEQLTVTNVNFEEIENLLKKYTIDLSNYEERLKRLLSKYGDIDKIKLILEFLRGNSLIDIVKNKPEILTKTLIYSDIDKLEQLKSKVNDDGILLFDLISLMPQFLYPAVSERINIFNSGGDSQTSCVSGALNNYIKNSDLLKQNKVSVKSVYKKSPSFFKYSYRTVETIFKSLKLYNISLKNQDGVLKNFFSIFNMANSSILDSYDIAIESDCIDYVEQNPTVLASTNVIYLYLIKLMRSEGKKNSEIFNYYTNGPKKICLKRKKIDSEYGIISASDRRKANIFDKYDACEPRLENQEIYDNIVRISQNNVISPDTYNDELIQKLEVYRDIENEYKYDFNGVVISRLKVLRYYDTLRRNDKVSDIDSLMYAITINSMLTEDEYENIKTCVTKVFKTGRSI